MLKIPRSIPSPWLAAGMTAALLATACGSGSGDGIAPPGQDVEPLTQAPSGPGGSDYRYARSVLTAEMEGHAGYRLFEPRTGEGAIPSGSLPLVYFLHGYGAITPEIYRSWIDHLVRKGRIVVWPNLQQNASTSLYCYKANAAAGIRAAIDSLQGSPTQHAQPDLGRVAAVGHSLGGTLAPNLAAGADRFGIPRPRAVMSATPEHAPPPAPTSTYIPFEDLAALPAATLLQVVVGEDDDFARRAVAQDIYHGATALPLSNRDYLTLRSDDLVDPPLLADHASASSGVTGSSPNPPNMLDWYGYWKLFDALMDAAFESGLHLDYALNGGAPQRFMGLRADRSPVTPLEVASDLPGDPATCNLGANCPAQLPPPADEPLQPCQSLR